MKHKGFYIATTVFFLIMNTSYFWESQLGMFAMIIFLLQIVFFLLLAIYVFVHILLSIKEKLQQKQRLFLIGYMVIVLTLAFCYPQGIIDFERFESTSVLIAGKEGAANCTTTLKLRNDHTFVEKSICFGISENSGTYSMKNDTIFFQYNQTRENSNALYAFAVIQKRDNNQVLSLHSNHSDTIGTLLWIVKNDLTKKLQNN